MAQGEVNGDLVMAGTYGLKEPPIPCQFNLPENAEWARVYTGVWGGTQKYTGWVEVDVNDMCLAKTGLYGVDDRNDNVYVTGYGVYWVAYDATSLVKKGMNKVVVNTSRAEKTSKIDGRVYAVFVVAAVKDSKAVTTKYWVTEGGENLHSAGWAGTNPTLHDESSVTFSGVDTSGVFYANLTTLVITSSRGEPDYQLFNGKELGELPSDPSQYTAGAMDLCNERSYDGGSGTRGFLSRYVDVESFDVTDSLKSSSTLTFLRGKDLDGDGGIDQGDRPEGEDYLHPVIAILTIKKASASETAPDLAVEDVSIDGAYSGEMAAITATLRNYGSFMLSPANVTYSVDGHVVDSKIITMDRSGVQQVTGSWSATPGSHTVKVEAALAGDRDSSNNGAAQTITVKGLPDLVLTVGKPYRPGSSQNAAMAGNPMLILTSVVSVCLAAWLLIRRPPGEFHLRIMLLLALPGLIAILYFGMMPGVRANDLTVLYILPITVKNTGGSDAPAFNATAYLDGEKMSVKNFDRGLSAGNGTTLDLPIHTSPGSHAIKVVVDDASRIKDANRANNKIESTYEFT